MKKTTILGKMTAVMLFFAITLSIFPTAYAEEMVYTINDVYFTNLSGTVLENPTTSCMVNVEVTKDVDRTANDLVVIASYSTDGAMIGFTIVGGTIPVGTTSKFSTLVVAPSGSSLGVVKAYVWNNIAQMKPLSKHYTKIVNQLDDGVELPPVSQNPVEPAFTANSRFAVVTKAAKAGTTENDSDCWNVEVLYAGEATTLQFTYANKPTDLAVGDAFFFEADSDGLIENYYIVYDHSTKSYLGFANALPSPLPIYKYDYVTTDGWSFNLADEGKNIQLAYAIVTQANGNTVELAAIPAPLTPAGAPVPVIDTNIRAVASPAPAGAEFLAFADDAQIYMYDVADTFSIREQDKFSIGTMLASNFSLFETATNSGLFNSYIDANTNNTRDAGEEALEDYAYYVLALIVDGDVVELYTITQ